MILIDTDVLLDVALGRDPHAPTSRAFLNRAQAGPEEACLAWHTVSNFHYVVSGKQSDAEARAFILGLMDWVEIAPTNADSVRYAASLPMSDFEDALQVAAARACDARQIVTRNLRDYEGSPIQAVSPRDALDALR